MSLGPLGQYSVITYTVKKKVKKKEKSTVCRRCALHLTRPVIMLNNGCIKFESNIKYF